MTEYELSQDMLVLGSQVPNAVPWPDVKQMKWKNVKEHNIR